MRVVWSEPAIRDLRSVRATIAMDNPRAADRQIDLIMRAASNLAQFPKLGRQGRRECTRELVISRTPYLLAYRINGDRIDILRVLHGRQRWPEYFD